MSRLVYRMLKFGTGYVARSLAEYEAQVREKLERSLRRRFFKRKRLHTHACFAVRRWVEPFVRADP